MGDKEKTEREQRNSNCQTSNIRNHKLTGETGKSDVIICDKNGIEIQNKCLPEVHKERRSNNIAKININGTDEIRKISCYSKGIQDTTANVKGSTAEGTQKFKYKKNSTFFTKAPTISIIGENGYLHSPKYIQNNKLEVNKNKGKHKPEENENKGRCPIYFGIKSYLHQFYAPPDEAILKSGEYIQADDFEFLVEPGNRRWRTCWFRVGMWVGINLLLLGLITLLVGYLIRPRQPIVGQIDNLEILDRWAIAFNHRLEIYRFLGLCVFCIGAVVVVLTLLVSSYEHETTGAYYVMGATVVPETFIGNPLVGQQWKWYNTTNGIIPVASTTRPVQPKNIPVLATNRCH